MQDNKSESRARLFLAGAAVAVFFTAFEVRAPVISLGPVGFTTSEIAALLFFVSAVIWARYDGVASFIRRRPLDLAVLLFLASQFLSSLAAEDRPSAFKFSLRMTYATLVYFCVSRLPQRMKSHLVIARAMTVALLLVVLIGFMENFVPYKDWPWLLSPFQEGISTFGTFFNVRVTSTLPFPTVLSMYLELTTPMAIALAVWMIGMAKNDRRRRLLFTVVFVVLIVIITVQVFTFTRSALVAMPLSMLFGAAAAAILGYGRRVWILFLAGTVMMVVITGVSSVMSERMSTRLELTEQEKYYDADYALVKFPEKLELDRQYTATIFVRNIGSNMWKSQGDDNVFLSYLWVRYPGKELVLDVDYFQRYLSEDIPPGGESSMVIDFMTPSQPGRYVIVFDLVQSHVSHFSGAMVTPVIVPLKFDEGGGERYQIPETAEEYLAAEPAQVQATRSPLWKAAFKTWKTNKVLGVGPDQFRHRYIESAPELPPDSRLETHNIFIQALTDTGVVGLAAMVFLLASALLLQFRLIMNHSLEPFDRYVSLALIVATVAYVVHGMLDYFLWQTGIAFLFFAYLGLTSWICQRARPDQ
ncbi:MAG: O-antigen ligase family protein [Thermoleophilia bacterium]